MSIASMSNAARSIIGGFLHRENRNMGAPKGPDGTIAWFLWGSGDSAKRRIRPSTKKPSNEQHRKAQDNDLEHAPGEHNKPLWTLDRITEDSDAILTAIAAQDDEKWERFSKRDGYIVTRDEWASSRMFGPFCFHDKGGIPKSIDVSLGIPNSCFLALNYMTNKKAEDHQDVMLIMMTRLYKVPNGFVIDRPVLGVYELILVNVYDIKKNAPRSFGMRRVVAIDKSGGVMWAKRAVSTATSVRHYKKGTIIIPGSVCYKDDSMLGYSQEDLTIIISAAISAEQQSDMNWRVRISDSRGVVNFPITIDESKKLFSKRDVVEAPDGRRKRIIHWARSHHRVNGQNVRTHLRGTREFRWNGFDVEIVLPGKHNDGRNVMRSSATDIEMEIPPEWIQKAHLTDWWVRKRTKERKENSAKTMTIRNQYNGESFEVELTDDTPSGYLPGALYKDGAGSLSN